MNKEQFKDKFKKNKTKFQIPKTKGIYFLWDNEELVYIGQSNDIIKRLIDHRDDERKSFTDYSYIETDRPLKDVETFLIQLYSPRDNLQYNIPNDLSELIQVFNLTEQDVYSLTYQVEKWVSSNKGTEYH